MYELAKEEIQTESQFAALTKRINEKIEYFTKVDHDPLKLRKLKAYQLKTLKEFKANLRKEMSNFLQDYKLDSKDQLSTITAKSSDEKVANECAEIYLILKHVEKQIYQAYNTKSSDMNTITKDLKFVHDKHKNLKSAKKEDLKFLTHELHHVTELYQNLQKDLSTEGKKRNIYK